jgi:hypothetical protein
MAAACPAIVAGRWPDLCRTVDAYCERTRDAFDAEPLNAATSLAMLIAAAAAVRLLRRHPRPAAGGLIVAMIATIVAGGFGAFLFHTTAAVWAVWIDVLPFLVFMLLALWLTLTRFLGWSAPAAWAGLAAFIAVAFGAAGVMPGGLSALAYYLVPLFTLLLAALALLRQGSPAASSYLAATAVFAAALAARQLDEPLCPAIATGTHFLWHLLAALLAFILIRAAIRHASPRKLGGN